MVGALQWFAKIRADKAGAPVDDESSALVGGVNVTRLDKEEDWRCPRVGHPIAQMRGWARSAA